MYIGTGFHSNGGEHIIKRFFILLLTGIILVISPLIVNFSEIFRVIDPSESRDASSLDPSMVTILAHSREYELSRDVFIDYIHVSDKQVTISSDASTDVEQSIVSIRQERKDRIRIMLTGVRLTEELTQRMIHGEAELGSEDPFVSRVYLKQDAAEESRFELLIDFHGPASYALLPLAEDGKIRIQLIPETYRVMLDPGHGGKDPGAIGASGRYEKEFTLELVNKVKERLMDELHFVVKLTRDDDRFVDLQERAQLAEEWEADVFISVHGNTFEQRISGTETYYFDPRSLEIAQHLHEFLLGGTNLPDREVRHREYRVLKHLNRVPGVLLEIGYLSNAAEEVLMWTEDFQDRVADSIVAGLKNYFVGGGD